MTNDPDASRRWNGHHGPVLHSRDGFDVIDCAACGFRHVVPIPDEDALRDIYKHDYHVKDKPLMLQHQLEDREWLEATGDARLAVLERLLGRVGSLLDVGAGNGFFLARAKALGLAARGVEPSDKAAAHARSLGLAVDCETFGPACAARLGRFDVVHLGEVLEHLPDPAGMLRLCGTALNPGGLLAVSVPNDYTAVQRVLHQDLGVRPWWVAPPHHLNYFDRDSLEGLFRRTGFAPCHAAVSFPMELFLLMGKNYLDDPALGRECHAMRKALELALLGSGNSRLLEALHEGFARAGMGRTLLVVGRKQQQDAP